MKCYHFHQLLLSLQWLALFYCKGRLRGLPQLPFSQQLSTKKSDKQLCPPPRPLSLPCLLFHHRWKIHLWHKILQSLMKWLIHLLSVHHHYLNHSRLVLTLTSLPYAKPKQKTYGYQAGEVGKMLWMIWGDQGAWLQRNESEDGIGRDIRMM